MRTSYYSHERRFMEEDSLIPDPPNYSLSGPRALKSCGVGGVRALSAPKTIYYAVNENRTTRTKNASRRRRADENDLRRERRSDDANEECVPTPAR